MAIVAYLVWKSTSGEKNASAFAHLWHDPKNWSMFAAALAAYLGAVLITFVRWWYLVRALGVPLRLGDSIRISFWGYLFNLMPLGIVGGDIVKTVMLAHEQPDYRAKSLASVLADRVIGLYVLFLVVTAAILLTGFWRIEQPTIPFLHVSYSYVTFAITIISTIGLAAVMGPDISGGRILQFVRRIPRLGHPLANVIEAVRLYNTKLPVLTLSSLASVGVHCLIAFSCYLIACGLAFGPSNPHLSAASHFVMVPMSNVTGVIPLPLGPFEFVLDSLYKYVSVNEGVKIAAGQGLVVALAYRLTTVLVLFFGIPYYFGNRREMAEVMHEAEEEEREEEKKLEEEEEREEKRKREEGKKKRQ